MPATCMAFEWGFSRTGVASESLTDNDVVRLISEWCRALETGNDAEVARIKGRLASAGVFRALGAPLPPVAALSRPAAPAQRPADAIVGTTPPPPKWLPSAEQLTEMRDLALEAGWLDTRRMEGAALDAELARQHALIQQAAGLTPVDRLEDLDEAGWGRLMAILRAQRAGRREPTPIAAVAASLPEIPHHPECACGRDERCARTKAGAPPAPAAPLPESGEQGACSTCGAAIIWSVTRAGKRAPLNTDGSSHFATCPHAARHRKPRAKKTTEAPGAGPAAGAGGPAPAASSLAEASPAAVPHAAVAGSERPAASTPTEAPGAGAAPAATSAVAASSLSTCCGGTRRCPRCGGLPPYCMICGGRLAGRCPVCAPRDDIVPASGASLLPLSAEPPAGSLPAPAPTPAPASAAPAIPAGGPTSSGPAAGAGVVPPASDELARARAALVEAGIDPTAGVDVGIRALQSAPRRTGGALELQRAAWKLAYVPLPDTTPPPEVDLGAGVRDEVAAAWLGRRLAEVQQLRETITAQRKALHAAVDEAADAAILRLEDALVPLRDHEESLIAWTRANTTGRRRYVDLMGVRLALRADRSDVKLSPAPGDDVVRRYRLEWIGEPGEQQALIDFAEERMGLDYVRRRPELERTKAKGWLAAQQIEPGRDGRAVVVDRETGEAIPVPGVRLVPVEDHLEPQITGAALAAPQQNQED